MSFPTITTIGSLNGAILAADSLTTAGTVTITLGANISLGTTALEAFNLNTGVVVDLVGGGFTLNGGGNERGLFVYAGSVDVSNLTISNMDAVGGAGGNDAGGGAGLGGGLFIGSNVTGDVGNVALSAVTFTGDMAVGGAGGTANSSGGGGGLGGNGSTYGAGGGVGVHGKGGGGTGIIPGAASGGAAAQPGGASGGGGGAGPGSGNNGGGGGGVGGHNGSSNQGGTGGWGGGGGGDAAGTAKGGAGGFGGGGGAGGNGAIGGSGGWGGGGGGSSNGPGAAGFGAGNGGSSGGGGGLGAGGDIFVEQGATLSIAGASTLNAGTVTGGASGATSGSGFGSDIYVQGNNWITLAPGAGQTLTLGGAIADNSGSGGTGTNTGTLGLVIASGVVDLTGASTFVGGATIESGAMLEIGGNADAATGNIVFGGAAGTLAVKTNTYALNTLSGFSAADTFILQGVTYHSGATASVVSGNLRISNNGINYSYAESSLTNGQTYTVGTPGSGDTVILACYAAGTRIATETGERAIESLAVDDCVLTAEGEVLPVIWLGRRAIDCARHPQPDLVWPVRIAAGALGEGLPARDLRLSPDHALLLDGFLVPARALINGATVVQERVDAITYWHLELASHDAILAEGVASETYLDTGNRNAFEGQGAVMTLHPRFGRNVHNALACAPFAEDGAVVKHIRARIAARAELLGYRAAEAGWTIEANGAPLARDEAGDWVVPAGAAGVTLRACTWRPADLEPGNTDTRRLGLCLAGLALDGAPVALDDARLVSGFHAMETSGAAQWRWTDGAAMIALAGERRLRLDLLRTPLEWRRAA